MKLRKLTSMVSSVASAKWNPHPPKQKNSTFPTPRGGLLYRQMNISRAFFIGFKQGFRNFTYLIANIVNFILLFFVYFVGIGLTSAIAKIRRKHFLDLKIDKSKKSYWLDEKVEKRSTDEYYRQF